MLLPRPITDAELDSLSTTTALDVGRYENVRDKDLAELNETEALLLTQLHAIRVCKNYKVKIAVSAGAAATAATNEAGLGQKETGIAAAVAAREAGGTLVEQRMAAAEAVSASLKALGRPYAEQADAISTQMGTRDENPFLIASRPAPEQPPIPQLVRDATSLDVYSRGSGSGSGSGSNSAAEAE